MNIGLLRPPVQNGSCGTLRLWQTCRTRVPAVTRLMRRVIVDAVAGLPFWL